MLLPAPPLYPRRRKPRPKARRSTPPAALTLVSASYDDSASPPVVTLAFDRAIDIAALDGAAVVVDDAEQAYILYDGSGGAVLLDPMTVRITLVGIGDPVGPGILLNASALSGIVAVAPPVGGTWAGVTNLSLPFP